MLPLWRLPRDSSSPLGLFKFLFPIPKTLPAAIIFAIPASFIISLTSEPHKNPLRWGRKWPLKSSPRSCRKWSPEDHHLKRDPTAKMTSKIISREFLPRGQNWTFRGRHVYEDTCHVYEDTWMIKHVQKIDTYFFIDILYFCVFNVRLNDYSSIYCNYFSKVLQKVDGYDITSFTQRKLM